MVKVMSASTEKNPPSTCPDSTVPDVAAMMQQIRHRVISEVASKHVSQEPGDGFCASTAGSSSTGRALALSEELRAINRGHAYAANLNPGFITSHRSGAIGRLVVAMKQRLFVMLRDSLFKDYFAAEHQFHAHLVRHLNDLTRELDRRAGQIDQLEARLAKLREQSK